MADSKISALTASTTPLAGTEVLPIVQSSTTKQVSVANLTAGRAVSALSLTTTQAITGGSLYQVSGFSAYRASGASVSSPGDASMYFNTATGQTLQARAGSSYDWSLINPGNASYIVRVPAGTLNLELAGGNLVIGTSGKGIDFSATSGTGTSELLADYEEGTFTPTVRGTSTVGTASYTSPTGSYTKVGRQVFFQLYLQWSSGTGAGNLEIAGLPFTSGSSTTYPGVTIGVFNNIGLTALNIAIAFLLPSSTAVSFYQYPVGGGSSAALPYDAAGELSLFGSYSV